MRHFIFPLLIGLVGCSSSELVAVDGSGTDSVGKIYGGSAPDQTFQSATVALHQLSGSSVYTSPFCSGTLITESVVLTAAHCLDTATRGKRFNEISPSGLAIYVGEDPSVDILSHLYTVSDVEIYSSYDRQGLTDDIALIQLSSAVTQATPVPFLPASLALSSSDAGATVNFAGFGQTETGSSGVLMQVDGAIGGLGCAVSGCSGSGDTATQVSYSQPTSGPCFGDSGGPMFIERSGTAYVAGVTSYGDSTCSVYGVSTRPDAFETWITAFAGEVVVDTGIVDTGTVDTGTVDTGTVDTGTVDTGTASSCGDGTCDTGESCDGRDGSTACSADCDGVTKGKKSLRYCEVGSSCEGPGCP
ncbi:MAG: secreted trypsin-like serine protease [Cognaticolwellia sp.]|jgi:secreted trypsin-like serine protease